MTLLKFPPDRLRFAELPKLEPHLLHLHLLLQSSQKSSRQGIHEHADKVQAQDKTRESDNMGMAHTQNLLWQMKTYEKDLKPAFLSGCMRFLRHHQDRRSLSPTSSEAVAAAGKLEEAGSLGRNSENAHSSACSKTWTPNSASPPN